MSKTSKTDQARLKVPETRRRALTSLPLPKLPEESSALAMEIENDQADHFAEAHPPTALEPASPQSSSYHKALNSTFNTVHTPSFALSPASTVEGRTHFQNQTYLNNAKARLAGAVATDFFARHEITEKTRARLLDWMIEVLKIYQQSEETLFRAFSLLDDYLAQTPRVVQSADLHLLGSTCMYVASKQEEVRPIKLNALVVDICKGKFSVEEIFAKELDVLSTIGFRSQKPDLFELLRCGLNVLGIEDLAVFSFVENISVLIGKMSLFYRELVTKFTATQLAASTLIMSLQLATVVHPGFCAVLHHQRIAAEFQITEEMRTHNIFAHNMALVAFETAFPYVRNVEAFHKFAG